MGIPETTIPLRFGQWHFWTHDKPPNPSHRQRLVFCLPPIEGQVEWAKNNYFPLMPQDVYALEYDRRIGKETMKSVIQYLTQEVTRLLTYHDCQDYSLMAYSMGTALAYGIVQQMSLDRQPKAIMFIDSSPVVLYMIKDLPWPETPAPKTPEEQRLNEITNQAGKLLKTMTSVTPLVVSDSIPELLLVKAKDNPPDDLPFVIPADYGVSQLTHKYEIRAMRGTHQTVNKLSRQEVAEFFESFAMNLTSPSLPNTNKHNNTTGSRSWSSSFGPTNDNNVTLSIVPEPSVAPSSVSRRVLEHDNSFTQLSRYGVPLAVVAVVLVGLVAVVGLRKRRHRTKKHEAQPLLEKDTNVQSSTRA